MIRRFYVGSSEYDNDKETAQGTANNRIDSKHRQKTSTYKVVNYLEVESGKEVKKQKRRRSRKGKIVKNKQERIYMLQSGT